MQIRIPLLMVVGVYGSTYATANLIDTVSERADANPTTHGAVKLFGTTAINMGSGVAKVAACRDAVLPSSRALVQLPAPVYRRIQAGLRGSTPWRPVPRTRHSRRCSERRQWPQPGRRR
jgi:hypothetical protein